MGIPHGRCPRSQSPRLAEHARLDSGAHGGALRDGGFVEVDATNCPGLYRFDAPDAPFAEGENIVYLQLVFTGAIVEPIEVVLVPEPDVQVGAVVTDVGNTSSTFRTDLTQTATDHWRDAWVLFRNGALVGQVRRISAFNPTTDFVTVATAFSAAPAAGDDFVIVNR